jgi:hypothetical protein
VTKRPSVEADLESRKRFEYHIPPSMSTVVQQFLGGTLCGTISEQESERARRRRLVQEASARSKTGMWGPTHSSDSKDSSTLTGSLRPSPHSPDRLNPTALPQQPKSTPVTHLEWLKAAVLSTSQSLYRTPTKTVVVTPDDKKLANQSHGTNSTKSTKSSNSTVASSPPAETTPAKCFGNDAEESTTPTSGGLKGGASGSSPQQRMEAMWHKAQNTLACRDDTTRDASVSFGQDKSFLRRVEDACISPCQPRFWNETFDDDDFTDRRGSYDEDDEEMRGVSVPTDESFADSHPRLGISSMVAPFPSMSVGTMPMSTSTPIQSNKKQATVDSCKLDETRSSHGVHKASGASMVGAGSTSKAPPSSHGSRHYSSGGSSSSSTPSSKQQQPESRQQQEANQKRPQAAATTTADACSVSSGDTPAERRRQRHRQRQLRVPPPPNNISSTLSYVVEEFEVTPDEIMYQGPKITKEPSQSRLSAGAPSRALPPLAPSSSAKNLNITNNDIVFKVPVESLTVKPDEALALQRSISELTMRSSYGEATAKLAENRRMAYYAVGRHHRNSGRGGNRRCYFTGRLILGGAPFYAGSVQQGLRTLVVFCLPSAIGLPKGAEVKRSLSTYSVSRVDGSGGNNTTTTNKNDLGASSSHSSRRLNAQGQSLGVNAQLLKSSIDSTSKRSLLLSRKSSRLSRLSSVDDMSLSIEEEMDANYDLDREFLLSVLPDPSQELLDEMAHRYPAQFETLPVQVRSPHCWRLYVKFCFFSGLPIAEGEMHYQVREEISEAYGEEIILSHEVMEAVNGDSAEILRLPNLKTFRYLRKHYSQQSGKLPEQAFQRQSWEMVRPEV